MIRITKQTTRDISYFICKLDDKPEQIFYRREDMLEYLEKEKQKEAELSEKNKPADTEKEKLSA